MVKARGGGGGVIGHYRPKPTSDLKFKSQKPLSFLSLQTSSISDMFGAGKNTEIFNILENTYPQQPWSAHFIRSNNALEKLQRVQNWAAKVILWGKKYDHVSPLLNELHWLPVVKRVQFKIPLLCYRCLNGSALQYLTSLLSPHKPPRNLHSSRDVLKLNVLCSKRLWGDRAFSVASTSPVESSAIQHQGRNFD